MVYNEDLKQIFALLDQQKLSEAIDMTEAYGMKFPAMNVGGRLAEIQNDYRLMADYWAKGYRDGQLEQVYGSLLKRMYRLAADLHLQYNVANEPYLQRAYQRVRSAGRDWSVAALKSRLEEFVSSVALLQLEPPHVREGRETQLYASHQQLMSDLFVYIWTSQQWSDGVASAFEELLLSPTVDSVDQQLLVSAIMLSAMNIFDMAKFRLLVSVYTKCTDEPVRQRALVGWVFSLGDAQERIFAEQREMLESLLDNETVCQELAELQIQLLYCVSAERDNRTIQREIMPDLLKHNGFRITPNGIEEKEEDTLENILHPEASEQNMERLEQSFQRMAEMQRQGSDIYFGGFSQMKRYSFFSQLSNWFVPFYQQHPEVSKLYKKMEAAKLIQHFVQAGPLCNSDRYSFVFAFQQVIDRLPANMREMLNHGEALDVMPMSEEERRQPAYLRRIYLQDLYRFFKLFPVRNIFYNPFGCRRDGAYVSEYVFFANPVFRGTALERQFNRVVAFMLKREMYAEAVEVLDSYRKEVRDYQFWMMCGHALKHKLEVMVSGECLAGLTPAVCYATAMTFPEAADHKALASYAKAIFQDGQYEEAGRAYAELLETYPDNKNYQLNYSATLVNLSRYEEALKLLYKLNYEYPENKNVTRVLARALTGDGRYEQAGRLYAQLCEQPADMSDLLNAGYCQWFSGNMEEAAKCFAAYLKGKYPETASQTQRRERIWSDVIESEQSYILQHGISRTECHLMGDLILYHTF